MIEQILDKKIAEEEIEHKNRKRSGKWNPSSFGRCLRAQVYKRRNVLPSNPPEKRVFRIFKVGHIFHNFIQNLIMSDNTDSAVEVKVETDDVLGFADIVIQNEIIEIKTQHSRGFWRMKKNDFVLETDKREHILQAMFYATELNKEYIRLVYVSKDDLSIEEFRVYVSNYWKKEIEKELDGLNNHWRNDVLPPAKPRIYINKDGKSKECRSCAWKDLCLMEESDNGRPAPTA